MAKTHFNREEAKCFETHIRCNCKSDLYSTALRIERSLAKGLIYVHVYFEYLDHCDPSFDENEWFLGAVSFDEFESLINYLLSEFNCARLRDTKPLEHRPCFHAVDAVFTRQEGTL